MSLFGAPRSSLNRVDNTLQTPSGVELQLMLPYPDHQPSCTPQAAMVQSIASSIPIDLPPPVRRQLVPPLWQPPTMPKVSLYKNCDQLIAKYNIWPPREVPCMRHESQMVASQQRSQPKLRTGVPTPYAGHYSLALTRSQVIH